MSRRDTSRGVQGRRPVVQFASFNHPVLDVPLADVLRADIALPLQHLLKIYTVGSFLRAWENPAAQPSITHLFDSADDAHSAAALCATWAGWTNAALPAGSAAGWMRAD